MEHTKTKGCLDSLTIKLLAMALMLCDHLWATVLPGVMWLTAVGRIAFPIFAFQVAEGFQRTHDRKKYLLRMLVFAAVSEIPFNLFYAGTAVYPFHQNVMFTFVLAILLLLGVEKFRAKGRIAYLLAAAAAVVLGYLLGTVTMVDYYGSGVVTVLIFYLCRQIPHSWIGELAGLAFLNCKLLGGMTIPLTLGSWTLELPEQGLALLALIPIWLYNGRQGAHNKAIQYACYAFYPAHMLILALLRMYL